jgi:tetratricopeptide (TPR) repeat protein
LPDLATPAIRRYTITDPDKGQPRRYFSTHCRQLAGVGLALQRLHGFLRFTSFFRLMKMFMVLPRSFSLFLLLFVLSPTCTGDEASPANASTSTGISTNTNTHNPTTIEPLPSNQELLEKLQREIAIQVARHTEAITSSLTEIGPALNRIQRQQAEASNNANQTLLIAAGLFTVAGYLGLGFLTMTTVRAMARFSELALASNAAPRRPLLAAPPEPPPPAALPDTSVQPGVSGSVERASARFQGALEQLEKRILELEHTSHPSTAEAGRAILPALLQVPPEPETAMIHPLPTQPLAGNSTVPAAPVSRSEVLMGKGQALLNLDQAAAALECFATVLAEEPENTDALIRQGMAFEKLQDWDRALQSYDRALALDHSLTVAHLHKGGVCNRLQRHREALECYEKALAAEPKIAGT